MIRSLLKFQQILQNSKPLQDTITVLAMNELSEENKLIIDRTRKTQCFLAQPFAVAHVFDDYRAHYSMLQDTIRFFKENLGFFKENLGDKDDAFARNCFLYGRQH